MPLGNTNPAEPGELWPPAANTGGRTTRRRGRPTVRPGEPAVTARASERPFRGHALSARALCGCAVRRCSCAPGSPGDVRRPGVLRARPPGAPCAPRACPTGAPNQRPAIRRFCFAHRRILATVDSAAVRSCAAFPLVKLPDPLVGWRARGRGTKTQRAISGRPRESRSSPQVPRLGAYAPRWLSSSGIEVLPAGSARRSHYSLSSPGGNGNAGRTGRGSRCDRGTCMRPIARSGPSPRGSSGTCSRPRRPRRSSSVVDLRPPRPRCCCRSEGRP